MFDVVDFSTWKEYDGFAEGSGRSEKIWLISETGQIGLFKYPKIDPEDGKETTEHISEHLAHQLGEILRIPMLLCKREPTCCICQTGYEAFRCIG